MKQIEKPQLHMILPQGLTNRPVDPRTDCRYIIRTYRQGDELTFLSLMAKVDFDPWNNEKLQYNMGKIIPEGWFFATEKGSEKMVATAMCLHNYSGNAPFTGDVGWLACDPGHRGRGLGHSLTAYITNRFIDAGYSKIQLHTEYYRLPAIKIYLKIGYLPVLYSPEVYSIWQEVCEQIGWAFTPDKWVAPL